MGICPDPVAIHQDPSRWLAAHKETYLRKRKVEASLKSLLIAGVGIVCKNRLNLQERQSIELWLEEIESFTKANDALIGI